MDRAPHEDSRREPDPRKGVGIEAVDLTRRFGGRVVLDRVDLRIEPGEAFGLLGANGAGKTTFLRLVRGTLLPSSGSIRVGDRSPASEPEAVCRNLGFVGDPSHVYPTLRVRSFLRFSAGARGLSRGARREAVEKGIARFHLESVADRPLAHLSKGFLQRVCLAQALLHDPPLLIADEPTAGLDPVQQREVWGLLGGLRGRRTLLLSTHDLDEARRLTDRVAVLHGGRAAVVGATADLLEGDDPLELFRSPGEARV